MDAHKLSQQSAAESIQQIHPLVPSLKSQETNDLQRRFNQIKSTQGMGAVLGFQMELQQADLDLTAPVLSIQRKTLGKDVLMGRDIDFDFCDYLSLPQDREVDISKNHLDK